MHNRYAGIMLCFVVAGIWFSLIRSRSRIEIQSPKKCAQWKDSSVLSNRCSRSLSRTLSMNEMEQSLAYLIPAEMHHHHDVGTADWYALVLFPSFEYEVARRCVLEGEDHPYCDSVQREKYHRLVNQQLMMMLASKNEEIQHRGMILACERSKKGRLLEIPQNASIKLSNMILYTQLCTESIEERQKRIRRALKDDSLRSMALLSLGLYQDRDVSFQGLQSWTPLEKSFAQGVQE